MATSSGHRGGTERAVFLLAAALNSRGIPSEILVPSGGDDSTAAATTRDVYVSQGVGTRVDDRFSRANKGWRNVARLRSLLRRGTGTVNIHYSTATAPSLTDILAIRGAGRRCVVTIHHPVSLRETSRRKALAIAAALWLADEIVVTTQYTKSLLLGDLPIKPRITVVPLGIPANPVADAACAARDAQRLAARKRLGVPADAFVVGHLARLVRYKGLFEVIDAMAPLRQGTPTYPAAPAHLLVAGDGPDRDAMEATARTTLCGNVTFVGDVSSPDDVYAASDLFVMPSSMEGFGLVYVEAAQFGVPSIASPVGGVPFVIRDGETGLLVARDPVAIAHAIDRLRDNRALLERLGRQARVESATRFSDKAMAEAYRDVLFASPRSRYA
jgi:glycosyltransferase involved in cell wall biosynthesis